MLPAPAWAAADLHPPASTSTFSLANRHGSHSRADPHLSPCLQAHHDSTHGYDVTDPRRISHDALARERSAAVRQTALAALAEYGLGGRRVVEVVSWLIVAQPAG